MLSSICLKTGLQEGAPWAQNAEEPENLNGNRIHWTISIHVSYIVWHLISSYILASFSVEYK